MAKVTSSDVKSRYKNRPALAQVIHTGKWCGMGGEYTYGTTTVAEATDEDYQAIYLSGRTTFFDLPTEEETEVAQALGSDKDEEE